MVEYWTNLSLVFDSTRKWISSDLKCQATKELWEDLKPILRQIGEREVTKDEMDFGISGNTARIKLRNWLTLLLRECILEQEGIAYKNNQGVLNIREIKIKYNVKLKE